MSADSAASLDAGDRALLRAIEPELPLVARPYAALAAEVGLPEAEIIRRLERLTAIGAIRRLGVVVRHRALGYRANAMVVWALPDGRVAELGARIGEPLLHPDTMWWDYSLGNVRERPFSRDLGGPLRPAHGRPEGAAAAPARPLRPLCLP